MNPPVGAWKTKFADTEGTMSEAKPLKTVAPWRQKLWVVIFESDTRAGKAFDVVLLIAILASVDGGAPGEHPRVRS
jgi:hypothetical protein